MRNHPQGRNRSFVLNKPFGMVSQFRPMEGKTTLSDLGKIPVDVYPVGRLDAESEGLLILTNDNKLKHDLLEPRFRHPRTYFVQVERIPDAGALGQLESGVVIEGTRTLPARARLLEAEPPFPPRPVPIRFRKNVPTAWIELILVEGRNRQVRKMTAAVGHPTLRLVRVGIGLLTLGEMQPGEVRELTEGEVERLRSGLPEDPGARDRRT
jgi:23S rRNA pseudouridine2457 synthase